MASGFCSLFGDSSGGVQEPPQVYVLPVEENAANPPAAPTLVSSPPLESNWWLEGGYIFLIDEEETDSDEEFEAQILLALEESVKVWLLDSSLLPLLFGLYFHNF